MSELIVNAVVLAGTYALVAVGLSLIYAVSRNFHLAHAAVYSSAAYSFYAVRRIADQPWWLAASLSLVAAIGVACAIEVLLYRHLRRRGASQLVILLASLGVLVMTQNIIALIFGDAGLAIHDGHVASVIELCGIRLTGARWLTVAAASVGVFGTWTLFRLSDFGLRARAVADDSELAQVVGINPDGVILVTTCLGSLLAGIAAILQAYDTGITPANGFDLLLIAVVATVIAGKWHIAGVALACLLLSLARSFAIWLLPGQWEAAAVFLVLLVFLMARPVGWVPARRRGA